MICIYLHRSNLNISENYVTSFASSNLEINFPIDFFSRKYFIFGKNLFALNFHEMLPEFATIFRKWKILR